MIYRVHKPIDAYGNPGSFVGYISLCDGYVNAKHIYTELIKTKMLQPNWVRAEEMTVSPHASTTRGAHSYSVFRKRPRAVVAPQPQPVQVVGGVRALLPGDILADAPRRDRQEQIFFLHPVESPKNNKTAEAKKDTNVWFSTNSLVNANYIYHTYPVQFGANQQVAYPAQPQPVNQNQAQQAEAIVEEYLDAVGPQRR